LNYGLVFEYKILQKEILSCVKAKARPEGTSHPKFINTHVSSSFEEGDLPIMMRITRSRRDFLPNSSHELYYIRTSTLIISYDCLLPLKMWIWLQRELNSWLKLKNLEVGNSILDAYSTIIATISPPPQRNCSCRANAFSREINVRWLLQGHGERYDGQIRE
jgi:hypothetical protein